uniref:Hydrophobic seed protein domain-containing protein n=1 Tax=Setaria italica TaxID=4555 RepID=K4A482_SETIT
MVFMPVLCGITVTCNSADSCVCVCEALEILDSSGIKLTERVEI